jgi:hypothetical protein
MRLAKKNKLMFLLLSFGCIVAIGVCVICDIALNKKLVWSWYPLFSVAFGWVVLAPLTLGGKRGLWFSLLTLTISVLPFLWLLERVTPVSGWFDEIAAPSAVITLAATWLMALIVRFIKMSGWYLAAVAVFLYGVIAGTAVRFYVSGFLGQNLFSLENITNFFACTALAVLLVVVGVKRRSKD